MENACQSHGKSWKSHGNQFRKKRTNPAVGVYWRKCFRVRGIPNPTFGIDLQEVKVMPVFSATSDVALVTAGAVHLVMWCCWFDFLTICTYQLQRDYVSELSSSPDTDYYRLIGAPLMLNVQNFIVKLFFCLIGFLCAIINGEIKIFICTTFNNSVKMHLD